jgi:hypothetical protein
MEPTPPLLIHRSTVALCCSTSTLFFPLWIAVDDSPRPLFLREQALEKVPGEAQLMHPSTPPPH